MLRLPNRSHDIPIQQQLDELSFHRVPYCTLNRAAGTVIQSATFTYVASGTVVADHWRMANSSLDEITLPYDGLWMIWTTAFWSASNSGTQRIVRHRLNRNAILGSDRRTPVFETECTLSSVYPLNRDQRVSIEVYQNTGAPLSLASFRWTVAWMGAK